MKKGQSYYKAQQPLLTQSQVKGLDILVEKTLAAKFGVLVAPIVPLQEFRDLIYAHPKASQINLTFKTDGKILMQRKGDKKNG